ncbi:MAG TPA: DNA polymerase III subunit beta [Saprospiraceae bacterium]|nr:DNA polymerase III subunit beta [Saprospiraceae bacterium]
MILQTNHVKWALSLMVKTQSSVLPILDNVLIEASNGNVTFTSTDLKTTVSVKVAGDGDLKMCLDTKLLTATISSLDDQQFDISIDDHTAIIKTTKGVYKMPVSDHNDYPAPGFSEKYTLVSFSELLPKLSKATNYTSTDELRMAMTGIYVNFSEGLICATDAHKLFLANIEKEGTIEGEKIISADVVNILSRINNFDILGIALTDRSIDFMCGDVRIKTTLIDAKYPNFKAIIPNTSNYNVKINRKALIDSIKRVKLYTGTTNRVDLSFTQFDLTVSAENIDFSQECKEVIECVSNGDIEISLSSLNILTMLNTFTDDEVELYLEAPNKAMLLKNGTDLAMAMPVIK